MASSLFFQGRVIQTPGSFTEVDASGLESISLSATGIVALIGEAEGGRPISAITDPEDVLVLKNPQQALNAFRSGDLKEASTMCFNPSRDTQIPGGAQQIVAIKTNPATQSTGVLTNSFGNIIDLTSDDYGAFTAQANINVAAGSVEGVRLDVVLEDDVEPVDNLGGNVFDVMYAPGVFPVLGWDTARMSLDLSGRLGCYADKVVTNGLTNQWTSGVANVVGNAANNGLASITVHGIVGGVYDTETIPVSAVNNAGVKIFTEVYGVTSSAVVVITAIDVNNTAVPGNGLITIAVGTTSTGIGVMESGFTDGGKVAVFNSGASVLSVLVVGLDASGMQQYEEIALSGTASVPALSTKSYTRITVFGAAPSGATTTMRANGFRSDGAVHNTVKKLRDYVNARQRTVLGQEVGFELSVVDASWLSRSPALLDEVRNVNILGVVGSTSGTVQSIVDFLQNSSQIMDGAVSTITPNVTDETVLPTPAIGVWEYFQVADTGFTGYVGFNPTAATIANVAAGLLAAASETPGVNLFVSGVAEGTTEVRLTHRFGEADFTVPVVSALVSNAVVTAGDRTRVQPSVTPMPVYLVGGIEGSETYQSYVDALNLLKKIRVNTIIVLTQDPSVHAQVEAHCQYMGTVGKSERDALVGLAGAVIGTLPTKSEIKAQIVDLNSRHIRACAQEIEFFDTAGTRSVFDSRFQAVLAGGMQASAAITLPLTHKFVNALSVKQHSSWNPVDDSDEMIGAGLWFMERRPNGRRVVRDVTTHLTSNNIAFVEASVNRTVNTVTFDFRNEMERLVGQPGTPTTLVTALNLASAQLNAQQDLQRLNRWRSLTLELILDVLEIAVEIAPVLPINFVRTVMHLAAVRLSAAA